MHERISNELSERGFTLIQSFLREREIKDLIRLLTRAKALAFDRDGESNLLKLVPEIRALAISDKMKGLLTRNVGRGVFAVNAVVLDKSESSNWGLDWHQDLKIPVCLNEHAPSAKARIRFESAPVEVLEKRITIRIHLDPCDETNGALEVIPRSHKFGILSAGMKNDVLSNGEIVTCAMDAGDVMVMKPLLLHKSPYSVSSKSRKVVHIDYAATALAEGLQWAYEAH